MLHLLDGPARDANPGGLPPELRCKRAPLYLRVVIDKETNAVDALDQLDDEPADNEAVFVYRREGRPWAVFVCARGRRDNGNRLPSDGPCDVLPGAHYRVWWDQPGEATLRSRAKWQQWAQKQPR